jgi:hypothetical protein
MLTITKFPFGAWLQHYNEFPAYMDGVLFYFFLSVFWFASEHCSGFPLDHTDEWTHLWRGTHCDIFQKDNTQRPHGLRFAGFRFGRPAFYGDTELRAQHLYFLRAASLAVLVRRLLFDLLSCAWKSALARFSDLLLAKSRKRQSGHGDEGARGDVFRL